MLSCNRVDEMSITVYNNCSDVEARQDLQRSVDKNKTRFQSSNITVNIRKENKCGYLLKYKNQERFIQGAITDMDLLVEAERFFDIDILTRK